MRTLVFLLTASSIFAAEWNRSWKVGASPDLEVRCDDGALELTSGPRGGVDARVVTRGWDIRPGEVEIVESQTGDRVRLHVRLPRRSGWSMGDRSVRVLVAVPPGVRLLATTGDGGITGGGLSGNLRLITGDGGIRAHDLDGSLEARTGDGGVTVSGRFDAVRVNTGDGGVDVAALPGSRVTASWSVETGDGAVRIRVPADISADLDARTGDGSLTVNFPGLVRSGSGDNSIRTRMNGGGSPMRVRTGDGSITIAASR